jgi:hypothetical protein
MPGAIFTVDVKDDLTAVTKAMSSSVETLTKDVSMLGNAFAKANTGNLKVGMKEANALFAASAGNMKLFRASLKDAGVSALDTSLMVGQISNELRKTRREALGIGTGFWEKVFNPRIVWQFSHSLNVLSKGLSTIQAVSGPIFSGIGKVASTMFEGGSSMVTNVIEAAQFRQNSLVAIASEMEGDEKERMKQAKDLFAFAQQTAKETPLDTKDVIAGIRDLKVAKFSTAESKLLFRLVADQASKHLSDANYGHKVIEGLTRIQGRGTAEGGDLESMRVAGFNAKEISMALAKNHPDLLPDAKSKFALSEEEGLKYVKEILGKGQIGSRTFINAVIAAAEKDKPDIGELAKQLGATSLTGAISNAKAAFTDLISSVDIVDWPGIQALIGFLGRISAALDANSETGKRFLDTVKAGTDAIFGGLSKITQSDINGFVDTLGKGILYVADTLEKAWKWFGEILNGQKSIGEGAEEMLIDVGVLIGEGIKTGFTAAFGESRKDKRIREKTGLEAGAVEYWTEKTGNKGFAEEFGAKYQAFKAAGQQVPQAKWYQAQNEVTYEAVNAWAQSVGYAMKSQVDPLTAKTAETMTMLSTTAAQSLQSGWQETLQQHSPSRVLLELGRTAAESLTGGLSGGFEKAEKSGDRSGGGDINVILNVNGAIGDPSAVGEALVQPVVRELTRIFRRVAREG